MFNNLRIKQKLIGGFMCIAAIVLVVGIIGYTGSKQIMFYMDEIGEVMLPALDNLNIIKEAHTAVNKYERTVMIRRTWNELGTEWVGGQIAKMDIAFERADKAWKIFEPLPKNKEEKAEFERFVPLWKKW